MKTVLENQRLKMLFFMLTDIMNESTELLYFGEGSEKLVGEAFRMKAEDGSVVLPGIVSRKKQLIPALFSVLQQ